MVGSNTVMRELSQEVAKASNCDGNSETVIWLDGISIGNVY